MTLDEDIKYWRTCAIDAETKSAMLVAFGVSMGLHIARQDYIPAPTNKEKENVRYICC